MAYLSKEKILVNADLYSPPAQGAPMPTPTAGMRTLYQNMRKQKLDVARHVPIHGRVGTNEEFLKIVGQTGAQGRWQLRLLVAERQPAALRNAVYEAPF